MTSTSRVFAVAIVCAMSALAAQAQKPAAPDATLFTNYYGTPTGVNWIVCGSTQQSSGCYDFGSIGPFVSVGAMLESNPAVNGSVVTRFIYVVDPGASPVTLYVYKKTDTVSSSFDTTVVTLFKTVQLKQLVGGAVTTFMAANNKFLFIGTSLSTVGVSVAKNTLKVTQIGGFSPPANVTSITADQYGYVTLTQGTGFSVFAPDGNNVEDGGGSQFMLGTTQAVPGSSLVISDTAPTIHMHIKPNMPPSNE